MNIKLFDLALPPIQTKEIFITLPDERFRALLEAKKFLLDLTDPKKTPKVPKAIRKHAYAVLRHFPWEMDLNLIAEKIPERYKKSNDV